MSRSRSPNSRITKVVNKIVEKKDELVEVHKERAEKWKERAEEREERADANWKGLVQLNEKTASQENTILDLKKQREELVNYQLKLEKKITVLEQDEEEYQKVNMAYLSLYMKGLLGEEEG